MRVKDPDKVEVIYNAALALVYEKGLASLTMASISRYSGLGMGTIYLYFQSKEELINSIYRTFKARNTQRIMAGHEPGAPLVQSFRHIFGNYLKDRVLYAQSHYFIEQAGMYTGLDNDSIREREHSFKPFAELLDHGKLALLIKDLPNELLIAQALGAANAIALLALSKKFELEKLSEQAFKMCWDAIRS